MEFGFFNNLILNLEDAAIALKADKASLKKESEKIFNALEEFYCLASSTINLVIVRLTLMLKKSGNEELIKEFSRLDKGDEWVKAQNNFKFCTEVIKLKTDSSEVIGELPQSADSQKWKSYLLKLNEVFSDEDSLALFISGKFSVIFSNVKSQGVDVNDPDSARKLAFDLRNALKDERRRLILQESKFISSIM
jgi:hypothetical protein